MDESKPTLGTLSCHTTTMSTHAICAADSTEATLNIIRNGTQASQKGPDNYFTGNVRIDPLIQAPAPAHLLGANVTFEPGARTAWHSHPLGQTLIVTAGYGLVQRWGEPVQPIVPGDVVWIGPGEKHWHGAAPSTAMTHIALVEVQVGQSADWMEQVSEEQYGPSSQCQTNIDVAT